MIDAANGYAYFATLVSPGEDDVVKVALGAGATPPSRVGAVTLNTGEKQPYCAVIDASSGYAYFGTCTYPGRVVKVKLGVGTDPPTRVDAVTLNADEDRPLSAVFDASSGYAYFGTFTTPGIVVRVGLSQKGFLKGTKFTMPEDGVVSSVSFYSHAASGNVRLALYDNSANPALLWESASTANTAASDWLTVPISGGTPCSLSLPMGTYWLAWQTDTAIPVPSYTAGVSGDGLFTPMVYGACPASLQTGSSTEPTLTDERWSEYVTYTVDTTPPTVVISSTEPCPWNTSPIPITVTFSEAVEGFDLLDIVVMNGMASNLIDLGGGVFTFDLIPTGEGLVCVDIAAGVAVAVVGGEPNQAADRFCCVYGTPPCVEWGTYLGGTGEERAYRIAVDSNGYVYASGYTYSAGWVSGGLDETLNDDDTTVYCDAYVVKLDSAGGHVWSTYLGGTYDEKSFGIAVDSSGNVYSTGYTDSSDWVSGGWDTTLNSNNAGYDGYVVKFDPDGVHLWSTYLGGMGHDRGYGLAVDSSGYAYATGRTDSSDWMSGGYCTIHGGADDAYVVKLNPVGGPSGHEWSTCLGGTGDDIGYDIAVDSDGNAYATGYTESPGWVSNGWNLILDDTRDVYVLKLSPAGGHLWSSYLGGADEDGGKGIAVDATENDVYVTGYTNSTGWLTDGWDTTYNGGEDGFVVKFDALGAHVWSTYLGGIENGDRGRGIAVDLSGYTYVCGRTNSDA